MYEFIFDMNQFSDRPIITRSFIFVDVSQLFSFIFAVFLILGKANQKG